MRDSDAVGTRWLESSIFGSNTPLLNPQKPLQCQSNTRASPQQERIRSQFCDDALTHLRAKIHIRPTIIRSPNPSNRVKLESNPKQAYTQKGK